MIGCGGFAFAVDPVNAVILEVLKGRRRPMKAVELSMHLPFQIGERAVQKRLKSMEVAQMVARPRGFRSGWVVARAVQ